ncbi:MAG TPA: TatD family hydrolase [Candidatus Polarisedimenticolaceae bacterium]|nr:TatD family hydrolase [Candidatus Polarisedimenticolaceae bacterium]
MIDSHCHLTHRRFAADRHAVVARAAGAGVEHCVTIGTGVDDARGALELAGALPQRVSPTAGLDPFSAHAAGDGFDDALSVLAELLAGGGFVALGEIGLDYHYDLDPRPLQRTRLERQLELAVRVDLPVVIHVRDAHRDMADVLAAHGSARGVIHSFTGGPAEAERYLGLGWSLAFNGVLTFRNATGVREAAALVPDPALLVETDSPYLAPVPHRGKRCEPAWVARTVETLAELRRTTVDHVDRVTTANARRLFRLGA